MADGHTVPRVQIGGRGDWGEEDGDGQKEEGQQGAEEEKGKEKAEDKAVEGLKGDAATDGETAGEDTGGASGKGKRKMHEAEVDGGGEGKEEEVVATLRFVVTGLCLELYTELHEMMRVKG
jgi:hypothetical protein